MNNATQAITFELRFFILTCIKPMFHMAQTGSKTKKIHNTYKK